MFYLGFFLFENQVAFGLFYAAMAAVLIMYLIVTMDEDGLQFSLHPVRQWRKRKAWMAQQRQVEAEGEVKKGE